MWFGKYWTRLTAYSIDPLSKAHKIQGKWHPWQSPGIEMGCGCISTFCISIIYFINCALPFSSEIGHLQAFITPIQVSVRSCLLHYPSPCVWYYADWLEILREHYNGDGRGFVSTTYEQDKDLSTRKGNLRWLLLGCITNNWKRVAAAKGHGTPPSKAGVVMGRKTVPSRFVSLIRRLLWGEWVYKSIAYPVSMPAVKPRLWGFLPLLGDTYSVLLQYGWENLILICLVKNVSGILETNWRFKSVWYI